MRPNNNNIENDNSPDLFLTQIPLGTPSLFQPGLQVSPQTHILPPQRSHQVPFSLQESPFQPRPIFSPQTQIIQQQQQTEIEMKTRKNAFGFSQCRIQPMGLPEK